MASPEDVQFKSHPESPDIDQCPSGGEQSRRISSSQTGTTRASPPLPEPMSSPAHFTGHQVLDSLNKTKELEKFKARMIVDSAGTYQPLQVRHNSEDSSWQYDYSSQQEVRWSVSDFSWVSREGRRVRPPQLAPSTAGASSNYPSWQLPSVLSKIPVYGRSVSGNTKRTSELESAMSQMNMGSHGSQRPVAGLPGTGQSGCSLNSFIFATDSRRSGANSTAGTTDRGFTATTQDRDGNKIRWDVSPTMQYAERPGSVQRTLNIKRIGSGNPARRDNRPSWSKRDSHDYRNGRVIEVLLTPPTDSSNVSMMTPITDASSGTVTRLRRFVIVNESVNDGNSFETIAIKTYNGQGVAAPNVIKSHHAIIFTGPTPPRPQKDELPRRTTSGGLAEDAMQVQAIRVECFNKGQALDPLARLDYGAKYIFDHGVPNIRPFGRIHSDYLGSLYAQYNHVWSMINNNQRRTDPATPKLSDTSSRAGSNTVSNAGSAGTVRPQTRSTRPSLVSPDSGPITFDEMRTILANYHNHARRKGLPTPSERLTTGQIAGLARDARTRAAYLHRFRSLWRTDDNDGADEDNEDDDDDESDKD